MKRRYFLPAFVLAFGTATLLLAAAGPSDVPATPTPPSAAETGLGPDLSSLDLTYDEKAFFEKARGLYYNYNFLGLKKFRCQVDDDGWDSIEALLLLQESRKRMDNGENGALASDATYKKLKGLKFILDYDHEKGFHFFREGYTQTGNGEYDKLADQMTLVTGKEVELFSEIWNALLGPNRSGKPEGEKAEIKVTKAAKGYDLSKTVAGQTVVWHFGGDGLLSEAWIPSPLVGGGTIHLGFTFQEAKGGHLPTVITFNNEIGDVSGEVQMDYGEAGTFRMPKRVAWHCEYPEKEGSKDKKTVADSLAFYNYELNDLPVESPLPQQPSKDPFYMMHKAFSEMIGAGIEFHLAFGPFLSNSPQINGAYAAYNGDFGIGYEFNPAFSLSADYEGADYQNHATGYDFYLNEIMLEGKYRLFTDDIRPYLLAGMGVGITEFFKNGDIVDPPRDDVNFTAEAGAGIEVRLLNQFFIYAQTAYVENPVSPSFAQMAGVGSSFYYVPLQFGVAIEK